MCQDLTGSRMNLTYSAENRIGDHICYYSDLRKMQRHYPSWAISHSAAPMKSSKLFCLLARMPA